MSRYIENRRAAASMPIHSTTRHTRLFNGCAGQKLANNTGGECPCLTSALPLLRMPALQILNSSFNIPLDLFTSRNNKGRKTFYSGFSMNKTPYICYLQVSEKRKRHKRTIYECSLQNVQKAHCNPPRKLMRVLTGTAN